MPYIEIDYSRNRDQRLDVAGLCRVLRDAAVATGIRVRALRADHVVIADGNADNARPDISVGLRGGRADAAKANSTAAIFAAAEGTAPRSWRPRPSCCRWRCATSTPR